MVNQLLVNSLPSKFITDKLIAGKFIVSDYNKGFLEA